MESKPFEELIQAISRVLSENDEVLFAYLYGSGVFGKKGRDVDIGVFSTTFKPDDMISIISSRRSRPTFERSNRRGHDPAA
jgi:predicted nucleotidyltransferase